MVLSSNSRLCLAKGVLFLGSSASGYGAFEARFGAVSAQLLACCLVGNLILWALCSQRRSIQPVSWLVLLLLLQLGIGWLVPPVEAVPYDLNNVVPGLNFQGFDIRSGTAWRATSIPACYQACLRHATRVRGKSGTGPPCEAFTFITSANVRVRCFLKQSGYSAGAIMLEGTTSGVLQARGSARSNSATINSQGRSYSQRPRHARLQGDHLLLVVASHRRPEFITPSALCHKGCECTGGITCLVYMDEESSHVNVSQGHAEGAHTLFISWEEYMTTNPPTAPFCCTTRRLKHVR
jgi:hypothetical protein